MRFVEFAHAMTEYWFMVCECQNFAYRNIRLIPLEDEETAVLQYAKTLAETLSEHVLPIVAQVPVLFHLPSAGGYWGCSCCV